LEPAVIEYRDWDAYLLGATDVVRTLRLRAEEGCAREGERWRRGRFLGIPEALADAIFMRGWEDATTMRTVLRPFARAFAGISMREFLAQDPAAIEAALAAAGAPDTTSDSSDRRMRLRAWSAVLSGCKLASAAGWLGARDVYATLQSPEGSLAVGSMLASVLGQDSTSYRAALRNFGAPLAPMHRAAHRALQAAGWLSPDAGRDQYQEAMQRAAAQLDRHPIALAWLFIQGSLHTTARLRLTACDLQPLRRSPQLALSVALDALPQAMPAPTEVSLFVGEAKTSVHGHTDHKGIVLLRSTDRTRSIAGMLRELAIRPGGVLEFAVVRPTEWELVRVEARGGWPASSIPRPQADW
jgi:hypothetical protein